MKVDILNRENLDVGAARESLPIRLPERIPIKQTCFRVVLDHVDLIDPKVYLKIDAYVSLNQINWRYFGGITYIGGIFDPQNQPGFMPWATHGPGSDLSRTYVKMIVGNLGRHVGVRSEVEFPQIAVID